MNPLSGFDFSILDDPEFREDAVREDIIAPILKELGYAASASSKIIRSRRLKHPYVHIGTRKNNIHIIPDYTLEPEGGRCWILDAKSPTENILKGKNLEQAFSYAIHPDVRAFRYALCNGRSIAVFHISKIEPEAVIALDGSDETFRRIHRLLCPLAFSAPEVLDFKPDFGIAMLKMGADPGMQLHFCPMGLPSIFMLEIGKYSAFVGIQWGDGWLASSFDFDDQRLQELLKVVTPDQALAIKQGLSKQPFNVQFGEQAPVINIHATFGKHVISDVHESYCPLQVVEFEAAH